MDTKTQRQGGKDRETRAFQNLELRQVGEGQSPRIVGHAAVFNVTTELFPDLRERIDLGAFSASLARGDDVRAVVDHDNFRLIGRRSAGTLTLREEPEGLWVEISPPDTTVGRDVVELIRRKDLDGMSIGFRTEPGGKDLITEDGVPVQIIKRAELIHVSVVAFPQYPEAEASLRSLVAWQEARGLPVDIFRRRLQLKELAS